ncbi:MAG TPA: fumarylacetoacetate hydrolase family protein [Vicinamibacterales bacterium]
MPDYVFPPPAVPSVAVEGEQGRFPVRRIFCVGRNYRAHAREMGHDPDREPPFFFLKPADAIVESGAVVSYPPETANLQYEIELVVAIGAAGLQVPVDRALDLAYGYAVGIDLTRRDLQFAARDAGRPWDWGKGFDRSAPCAAISKAAAIGHPARGRIWLSVNGAIKQEGDISDLIWSVPEVISAITRSMALKPGDLIFTGTPAGVGPIVPGDVVTGGVHGVGEIVLTIA